MSKYTFLILSLILFGCQNKNPCETLEENVPSKDGVIVSYEVRDCGDIALIFIHGWCSNRSFWNEQLDTLSQIYKTIAIDLPGHGESGKNRNKWSISSFADDVESVIQHQKLDHIVLIGHSMGGLVALEADFKGTLRMAMPRMFSSQTPEKMVQWVTDNSIRADSIMAISIARDASLISEKDLLLSAKIPIRCIYGEYGDLHELHSRVETNSKYADYKAVLIKNVGHFPFLENPKETNKYLKMYITELVDSYIVTDK